jgi:hypothetical protein
MHPLLEEKGYFSPHALDCGVVELVRKLLGVHLDGGDISLGPSEGPFRPPVLSPTKRGVSTQTPSQGLKGSRSSVSQHPFHGRRKKLATP